MKRLGVFSGILATGSLAAIVVYALVSYSAHAITSTEYTCSQNGTFADVTTGDGAITTSDGQASTKALSWLQGQTKTTTVVTTNSTLAPTVEEDPSYQGPIDGTFTLSGASYPTTSDASLTIDSPITVPDSYAGTVQGHVLTTPTANRWIIQVYKNTSSGYVQVAKQALADGTTGDFTIDLSTVSNPPAGSWAFGILDANNSYAPYGGKWPSPPYYNGLEVQQKLVTDAIYDWSTTKAYADGTFHFDNSNTGKKLFRLVDTASGNILAEYVKPTGLVRSYIINQGDPAYGTGFANESFSYDQAVALMAALSAHNQSLASSLVQGLLALQDTTGAHSGAFDFSGPQLTPTYRDDLIRTGAHAIATTALLSYIEQYPSDPNISSYTQSAEAALAFLDTTHSTSGTTSGLYLGGFGDYSGTNGAFNPATVIDWASTEHNLDIWQTFMTASRVLGNTPVDYNAKASALQTIMQAKLYNAPENRYNQGMDSTGPDTADPLDVNSWGAIQLYASGQYDQAIAALGRLAPFTFTRSAVTGYAPFYNSAGYPGALPNVWFEGSFGVALAQLRTGNVSAYRTTIENLKQAQESDGSFLYATDTDNQYQIYPREAVASTAWYILATTGRSALWNECIYNPPVDPPSIPAPGTSTPASSSTAIPAKNTAASIASDGGVTGATAPANTTQPATVPPSTDTKNTAVVKPQHSGGGTSTKVATSIPPWVAPTSIGAGIVVVGGSAWGLVGARRRATRF